MRDDLTRHLNRDVQREQLVDAELARLVAIRSAIRPIAAREPGGVRGNGCRPHLTLLVQEVWLKLERSGPWRSRAHFLAAASNAARQVLIDEARRRQRRIVEEPLPSDIPAENGHADLTLRLGVLLEALERVDPTAARVASFKIFGGLPTAAIAEAEGVSSRTVERHWRFAQAWLADRIERGV